MIVGLMWFAMQDATTKGFDRFLEVRGSRFSWTTSSSYQSRKWRVCRKKCRRSFFKLKQEVCKVKFDLSSSNKEDVEGTSELEVSSGYSKHKLQQFCEEEGLGLDCSVDFFGIDRRICPRKLLHNDKDRRKSQVAKQREDNQTVEKYLKEVCMTSGVKELVKMGMLPDARV